MPRPLNLLLIASLLLTAPAQSAMAQGGEPSREPILRIETGTHNAIIRRISVDLAGRFLATASDDKTARVWDVQSGRLLRVLRVPVGGGNEGRLFAVAISPNGSTVAVGGWTGYEWDKQYSVYIFDRESGRLFRRLTGLPNVVLHLAFSPDGALLVATLFGNNGGRVWYTPSWTEVRILGTNFNVRCPTSPCSPFWGDTAYGDSSYGVDFDPEGRLVTSSWDGNVRLYDDRRLSLLVKRAAPGGKRPYAVRFSPDGRKIAVGYADSTRVDVLDGKTLALQYSADSTGITKGDMGCVAWSTDGSMLYAGGSYADNSGLRLIRRWSDAGRGHYVDMPAAGDTILDITPLPTGGIAYSAAAPLWGILDSRYKQTQPSQAGQIADYRDSINSHFLTGANAGAIRFGYEQFGRSPAVFQLSDRTLTPDAPATSDMRPPRTEAPGISVTDWKNAYSPRLNNKPLKLKQYEIARSLAVAPDGERFLLGTEFFIRLFNRNGQELWNAPSSGPAWAVNISGDGRLALAAYGDGTIRWYRMTDGKELLSFFPLYERRKIALQKQIESLLDISDTSSFSRRGDRLWVLWTPSGYYDASPGAEDLIGWHVNNGRDAAADFFPVGQFRSVYYRPDVVSKILQTGDEQLALKEANEEAGRKQQQADLKQMLPPVVEIVSPSDGAEVSSNEVTVRYSLRTPSGGPVTEVRALVDGGPANARSEE